jgi:hypothetical protein
MVRFGFDFISKKPEPNKKKSSQTGKTGPNRVEPVFVLKNRTKTGRFCFFFIKISIWLHFFDKNRTEPKMTTPKLYYFTCMRRKEET